MLKINGNKLSAEGFQFELPEGCYIDTEGMEGLSKHSIRFLTPSKEMSINMRTDKDAYASSMATLIDSFTDFVFESGSAIELYDDESNTDYRWIEKPTMFEKNGMTGTRAIYTAKQKECCRIYFDRIDGYSEFLAIYMETYGDGVSIIEILDRPEIKRFFDSLKPEK